jgi:predicted nucleic acid-binding protein
MKIFSSKTCLKKLYFFPGRLLESFTPAQLQKEDRKDLESLRQALGKNIVETTVEDWILAGRCIALYTMRYGKVRPRDHILDILIAITAANVGAVLVTENLRDMKRWKDMLGRMGKGVKLEVPKG